MEAQPCRFCRRTDLECVLDLGLSPLANAYVPRDRAADPERFYPLSIAFCRHCALVQAPDAPKREAIFTADYAYFSSYSETVLEHSKRYVEAISARLGLGANSRVVEVASNDGYLLQFLVERGADVLGIEPCESVARVAIARGVPTRVEFFGVDSASRLAGEGSAADLLIGNNVLAHVPDLNDFVGGVRLLLAPEGVATFEFPHLLKMLEKVYFDTIYHEHYSYLSLIAVETIFQAHGLRIFDVEEITPQGGSLRIYACHSDSERFPRSAAVTHLRQRETAAGLTSVAGYAAFAERVRRCKRALVRFLMDAQERGRSVVGYGAPAKGNTLLNACGIKSDLLAYTVDVNPHKQGHLLPGSRIPILPPEAIFETKPDYVLILPWNIKEEIMAQMAGVAEWGGRFVVPLPELTVLDPPAWARESLATSEPAAAFAQ